MTDAQIEKVLQEGCPVAAVLLSRGGWLKAERVAVACAFAADAASGAVWKVSLSQEGEKGSWHDVFVTSDGIVGISIARRKAADNDKQHFE